MSLPVNWSGTTPIPYDKPAIAACTAMAGELLRLDRLVRSAGQWWVLDYKSASRPEQDPALVAKMRLYRDAVVNANPGMVVNAAFHTGHGKLVPVE